MSSSCSRSAVPGVWFMRHGSTRYIPWSAATVSPAQIARLRNRLASESEAGRSRRPARVGPAGRGRRAAVGGRRADRRRHRRRWPARRPVHRLDHAYGAREHGRGRHDAGRGAEARQPAPRPTSSASETSAGLRSARARTSSCSTPIRSTTSRTRGASSASSCAGRKSIEPASSAPGRARRRDEEPQPDSRAWSRDPLFWFPTRDADSRRPIDHQWPNVRQNPPFSTTTTTPAAPRAARHPPPATAGRSIRAAAWRWIVRGLAARGRTVAIPELRVVGDHVARAAGRA